MNENIEKFFLIFFSVVITAMILITAFNYVLYPDSFPDLLIKYFNI